MDAYLLALLMITMWQQGLQSTADSICNKCYKWHCHMAPGDILVLMAVQEASLKAQKAVWDLHSAPRPPQCSGLFNYSGVSHLILKISLYPFFDTSTQPIIFFASNEVQSMELLRISIGTAPIEMIFSFTIQRGQKRPVGTVKPSNYN